MIVFQDKRESKMMMVIWLEKIPPKAELRVQNGEIFQCR